MGQEHITKTLAQAVKTGRIAHAYLFTGPKGIGKTSIARILAHDINQLEYKDDSGHIDIIEIDAASNRKLEETKELIEKVYVAPVSAKYKVYIIDEVHMLTRESFNVLLKTLEEPPSHAVFILATTEAHKLPATIISRTQRFQFKPIEAAKVMAHLRVIADNEHIQIDDDALKLIAEHGQGSFRDSISLMDQASNYSQPVSADTVLTLLGMPPDQLIDTLIEQIESDSVSGIVKTLQELGEQGYPPANIASRLGSKIRERIIAQSPLLSMEISLKLLENLIEVPGSYAPSQSLEIGILKNLANSMSPKTVKAEPINKPIKTSDKAPPLDSTVPDQAAKLKPKKPTPIEPSLVESIANRNKLPPKASLDQNTWQEVLNLLKSRYNTLYGIVRMANVDFSRSGTIKLAFAFPFHQKRVSEPKNREIIQNAIFQSTGKNIIIECRVDPSQLNKTEPDKRFPDELETINSIFGGGATIE
ncbi:MAG: DNA polymerase III subunit gamma/tau [Firmicutes bacterium]|nr:DNA polymerase III subunit gamma/tau [Bacillota bacterium]